MPQRTHLDYDSVGGAPRPQRLTKQEFGRRVYRLMLDRGWNQSELARQADLPRDSISVYVRGVSLPTPGSLEKLAKAFDMDPAELLPNHTELGMGADPPSLELRVNAGDPSNAWLCVNRLVTMRTATKIVQLLEADDAALKPEEDSDRTRPKRSIADLLNHEESAHLDFEPELIRDGWLRSGELD